MAPENNEVVILGKVAGQTANITRGPGDLDLFLCLRGTHRSVTFFTDRVIKSTRLGAQNGGMFISVRILALERKSDPTLAKSAAWLIKGVLTTFGHDNMPVEAEYDPIHGNGTITFKLA